MPSLFVRTSDDIAPIYSQHHVLISFEILQATAVSQQQQSSGLKQITRPSCSTAYNSTVAADGLLILKKKLIHLINKKYINTNTYPVNLSCCVGCVCIILLLLNEMTLLINISMLLNTQSLMYIRIAAALLLT